MRDRWRAMAETAPQDPITVIQPHPPDPASSPAKHVLAVARSRAFRGWVALVRRIALIRTYRRDAEIRRHRPNSCSDTGYGFCRHA